MITSLQNPRIKSVVRLLNRKERDLTKRFPIEGFRETLRALEKHFPLECIYFCDSLITPEARTFLSSLKIELVPCSEPVFRKISYRDSPDGILAIGIQVHKTLSDLPLPQNPLYLIAESVEKPGNLGSLLRSCDGAGIDALLLSDKLTDIYNPNVVRASVGTLFSVPIIESDGPHIISTLKKNSVQIIAATPESAIPYTSCDFTKPSAIVVGTEHEGLSPLWKNNSDIRISIPMHGLADSLNVSAAATLLLYEALRQRAL